MTTFKNPASFDFEDRLPDVEPAPVTSGPETTCVYFGAERLARTKVAAKAAKQTFSAYVATAVDTAMGLDRERLERLAALAKLRGVSPMALLAQLIDKATNAA